MGHAHTEAISRNEWYRRAPRFQDRGFPQSLDFNTQCAIQQSTSVEHVKVVTGSEVVGLVSVRLKHIPFLGSGIACIGGGPLTRVGETEELSKLAVCLTALQGEYVLKQKLQLRISAPLATPNTRESVEKAQASCGFSPSRPRFTAPW